MSSRQRQGSADTALFLALFLVVQALLAGLASGARADPFAASLGVICGADGVRHPAFNAAGTEDGAPAGHAPDCCSFGCVMAGGALPPPALATLGRPGSVPIDRVPAVVPMAALERAELSPVLSRAPPSA